jgi:hypothetical protein
MSESLRIRRYIGLEHLNVGTDSSRIGDRHTDLKPDGRRRIVHRDDLERVMLFIRDNPRFTKKRVTQPGADA